MKTNSQRIVWNEPHDTLAVFVLDDFENRLERSNNHVPRWETNGVFFAQIRLYRTLNSQNEPQVVLQGQPKCAYEANAKPEDSC